MVLEDLAIQVTNLSIEYIEFKRSLTKPFGVSNYISALNNINFSIDEGEVIALIGRNGAGKSTLLRSIAGLLRPTDGTIETNGRVILLASANPGFSLDVSGRQNILELASAYGVAERDIIGFCESIIEFAQIGDAIDRNFRGYSTGMKGKLGFGFITTLEPEILLIDETLGVGDAEFRKKAMNRLRKFVERSGSVIISTHSIGLAREMCSRGIVLNEGSVIADEEIDEAIAAYTNLINQ